MINSNFCPVCSQTIYEPLLSQRKKELDAYYQLRGKLNEAEDKLHRRNMQIKELKKQLQDVIPTSALSWKCFTCGQVYKFSTLEPLKNIIPSCFCNKPDCRIIINR